MLFEIYKIIMLRLHSKVKQKQKKIIIKNRYQAIKDAIDCVIETFIEYDKHIMFTIEFDAMEKNSQQVSQDYDDFYQTINFIYDFLLELYQGMEYDKEVLYQMTLLIIETILGLVYRYGTTSQSNYKYRLDPETIGRISEGLVYTIRNFEKNM